jgi:putative ABC transport system permease protein
MRLLFGNSGRLGSRNIQRARLRTALTVAALMIGVAMIIVVWVMTDSFKSDLDTWLKGYIGGDLYVTSNLPMKEVVWKRLQSVEGVAAVTPVRYFEVKWKTPSGENEKIVFMAVDPVSHSQVTSFVYSQPLGDPQPALAQLAGGGSVFISSVLAEKYNLALGDQITLATRAGEQPFNIAAVVVDYYNQGLVVDGSWVDMSRYFRQKGASAYLVKVQPGASIEAVKQIIDARYGDRYRLIIESNQALLGRVSTLMNQAFSMFDVLALIAMLVGFMGIMNTLTMNVMERIQEIGMLRGVGMTRGQVVSMVLAEAALMGLIGGILGLVFGVILSRIIMLGMTAMSGYQLTYILPLGRVFLALFMALVISVIAALLPAQRAARVRILEAIHYE